MGCKSCGCSEVNVSSGCTNCGTPYYKACSGCPEDHTKLLIEESVSPAITVKNQFNIPDCLETAVLQVPGLKRIGIGSRIWADTFGFLTVVSFDAQSESITVRNDCMSCNADVGTSIPACTIFTVDSPNCGEAAGQPPSIFPFQVSDFVVPEEDGCVDIEVTNVNGLSTQKNVSIAGNTYLLDSVLDATHIRICNKGDGGTPGTTIFAEDDAGNLIHPVVLQDNNPCTNVGTPAGKLMVCKEGILNPLTGSADFQIPVLTLATGEVTFQNLLIPTGECSPLTACLITDPTNPANFSYLIIVGDTSIFVDGQVITIGGVSATIDSIDSATQMHIIFETDPIAVVDFEEGTPVCEANCCVQLEADVFGILDDPCGLMDRLDIDASAPAPADVEGVVGDTTLAIDEEIVGDTATFVIENNSACRNMVAQVTITYLWRTRAVIAADDDNVQAGYAPQASQVVNLIAAANPEIPLDILVEPLRHGFWSTGAGPQSVIHDAVFTHTYDVVIPPLNKWTVKAAARLQFTAPPASPDALHYTQLGARISGIGITG